MGWVEIWKNQEMVEYSTEEVEQRPSGSQFVKWALGTELMNPVPAKTGSEPRGGGGCLLGILLLFMFLRMNDIHVWSLKSPYQIHTGCTAILGRLYVLSLLLISHCKKKWSSTIILGTV
jgi:hypothetical protein